MPLHTVFAIDPGTAQGSLQVGGATILLKHYAPTDPDQSLTMQTISATEQDVLKKLVVANNRVSGQIEHIDARTGGSADLAKVSYAAQFSAPLFHEPRITADLRGKAAQDSPQTNG